MPHIAEVASGVVVRVITVQATYDVRSPEAWAETRLTGTWLRCDERVRSGVRDGGGDPLRKNYPGAGYNYDAGRDAFIPPRPYASWALNESTCQWEPPVLYPNDGRIYRWNETRRRWERA